MSRRPLVELAAGVVVVAGVFFLVHVLLSAATWALYFGLPSGAVYSNLVASAICGVLLWWRLRARMAAQMAKQMAQAARHHQEKLDQATEHHEALKAQAQANHNRLAEQAAQHHEALRIQAAEHHEALRIQAAEHHEALKAHVAAVAAKPAEPKTEPPVVPKTESRGRAPRSRL